MFGTGLSEVIEISLPLLSEIYEIELMVMWNPDNPKKEKTISLYKQIQKHISIQAVSGKALCDHFEERGYKRKAVSSLARDLYIRNKVERTKFKTREGHIYGKNLKECLIYGIEKKLIPKTAIAFFKIIMSKGFVTNQQLIYEFGFEIKDINWIRYRLIKNHYFNEKVMLKHKLSIYYCGGLDPKEYQKTEEYKKWHKWTKEFPERIKKEGSWFEDKVEEIYQRLGYQTIRNRWYKTDKGSFEVDILAWRHDPFGIRTVYVSCKKYRLSMVTSYDLLKMVTFRRLLKRDYGEIHIWGWNKIAQSVWKTIPAFPFVRIFYKKDFLKLCDQLKIKVPIDN